MLRKMNKFGKKWRKERVDILLENTRIREKWKIKQKQERQESQ